MPKNPKREPERDIDNPAAGAVGPRPRGGAGYSPQDSRGSRRGQVKRKGGTTRGPKGPPAR